MGLRELKTELNKLNKAELIKHISELYKKYKPVKEYFDFFINPDETALLEQYKEKVTEAFFPKRGFVFKLSAARKAINAFKKLGTSPDSIADLMLHYVECGVELTNTYGDIDENFYTSMENTYAKALDLIYKNGLLEKYRPRTAKIVDNTENTGWGFHDSLLYLYDEYYD